MTSAHAPGSAGPSGTAGRDLRLPAWGPYSKRYAGTSHVADPERGTRWDLTVVPGYFRGDLVIPDGLRPSRFHPWEAAPGLRHYTYRYELEWKDQVYCDVSFTAMGDHARLITCEWVNATDHAQHLVSHAVASMDFARVGSHREWLRTASISTPDDVTWVDALDYASLHPAEGRADRGLAPDGLLVGERRAHGAVSGSVLSGLGGHPGDAVVYELHTAVPLVDAVLRLRYRLPAGARADLLVDGTARGGWLRCIGGDGMRTTDLDLGHLPAGPHRFALEAPRGASDDLEIDGFLIGPRGAVEDVAVEPDPLSTEARLTPAPDGGFLIEPSALEHAYGVAWSGEDATAREFIGNDLDMLLRGAKYDRHGVPAPSGVAHDPSSSTARFLDIVGSAILVPPRSRRTVHGLVCDGSPEEVSDQLATFARTSAPQLRALVDDGHGAAFAPPGRAPGTAQGAGALDSQRRMAATLLTNVVYPIYLRRQHVRHFAPGRWWDSLYTWDSGMIGLGLVEIDPTRAQDCLESYLTGPGDPHSAFIHHGTTLPTQQYLAAELLSRSGDRAQFERWYPGLREQYRFLSGSHPESRTGMSSGLLNPFEYFYNSGGWDDYPAQVETHRRGLSRSVAPMVTASHALLTAKLLLLSTAPSADDAPTGPGRQGRRQASVAGASDLPSPAVAQEDAAGYLEDIERMTAAVQQCWDPDSGYFGYAVHDADGAASGLLRDENGVNLNCGLDGAYPLVAGACTSEQAEALLTKLFSPEHLWTDVGISAVDRSAPYFREDGYWNGQVWIAHQWFLFRSMFDLGRPDLARRIADAVLRGWGSESERTYNSWEHFSVTTGRGGGWHQFGGLSSPVLNLFASYHRPGALTTGFGTRILSAASDAEAGTLTADLLSTTGVLGAASAVVAMAPGRRYDVLIDGEHALCEEPEDGLLHITWSDPSDSRPTLEPVARSLQVRPRER